MGMEEKQMELAGLLEESERSAGLDRIRQALEPQVHEDFDGVHCMDCGDEIPLARLQAKRIFCTKCQTAQEHRSKGFRR